MRLYSENKEYKLYQGDMLDMLQVIEPNSIDSIVTDPPYELNFMGKGWDNSGIAFQSSTWQKCLEVLKPGGYLLAFGGSRTYHRIACAIEDAGFEIRDTIMWLYGSGFPKSLNIANAIESKELNGSANKKDFKKLDGVKGKTSLGYNKNNAEDGWRPTNYNGQETTIKPNITTESAKKWQGWGSALKPSYEPIIVARKPFAGSLIDNVIQYGVGGLNIDECRVAFNGDKWSTQKSGKTSRAYQCWETTTAGGLCEANDNGRFPANTILTYDDTDEDEVCGGMPVGGKNGSITNPNLNNSLGNGGIYHKYSEKQPLWDAYNDEGSAARYFLNAEFSNKDDDSLGRFPANTILTYDETDYEDVCGGMPESEGCRPHIIKSNVDKYDGWGSITKRNGELVGYADTNTSASRYFYCAKASKKDRDEGLRDFKEVVDCDRDVNAYSADTAFNRSANARKNIHPTVKPTELMQYLVRLVTPNGGTVLDPFNGSGSTGKAVMYENRERAKNYKYIGIELTEEYLPISKARIEYACNPSNEITWEETEKETGEIKKTSYQEVSLF